MTLERTHPPVALVEDDFIPHSPSQKRRFFTLQYASRNLENTPNGKPIKEGFNLSPRQTLNRTSSDTTYVLRTRTSGLSDPTWGSTEFLAKNREKTVSKTRDQKHSIKPKLDSTVDIRSYSKANGRSDMVSSSHVKESDSHEKKRYGSVKGSKSTSPSGKQFHQKTTQSALSSGEVLLDFPPSSDNAAVNSPKSKIGKTKDSKSSNRHQTIQHAVSMPGLIFDSESKSEFRDKKMTETKARSFFLFFRRKKKDVNEAIAPSCPTPNHLLLHKSPSTPCSLSQTAPPSDLTPSPLPKERRISEHSFGSSKLPPNSSIASNNPHTPTSPKSLISQTVSTCNSPSTPGGLTKSDPNSKPRRRKTGEYRRRSHRRKENAIDLPEDEIKLEDLPPHPSVVKRPLARLYNFPSTPVQKPDETEKQGQYGKTSAIETDIRRNSMPETSALIEETPKSSNARLYRTESWNGRKNSRKDIRRTYNKIEKEQLVRVKDSRNNSTENFQNSIESTKDSKKDSLENCKDSKGCSTQKLPEPSCKTPSEEDSGLELTTSSSDHPRKVARRTRSVPSFRGSKDQEEALDTRVISDAEDFEYQPSDLSGPLHLSLCGCGFLGMYHLGVVACLHQRASSFLERVDKVGGASAGAIMAAILLTCPEKVEETAEHLQNLAREVRKKPLGPLTPGYNFTRSLRWVLEVVLPEEAHRLARDKLFVSLTNVDTRQNELLTDFSSRDELIDTLLASCYIPIYAGSKIPAIRGKKYMDGGLSNNMPRLESGRTITVSPFDRKSEIGPKVGEEADKKTFHFFNSQNQEPQISVNNVKKSTQGFFPPKQQALQDYLEQGRYDASRFLIREGLYEITTPTAKKAVLYESSV